MGKLNEKLKSAEKALDTLKEVFDEEYSVIVRDAAIQRFEYTFEAVWKVVKVYLQEVEGVIANSPKSAFRESFSVGLVSEEDVKAALEMVDDRNLTTHTYLEEVAKQIYDKLPAYYKLMKSILNKIS